jgi:hypothetical protein
MLSMTAKSIPFKTLGEYTRNKLKCAHQLIISSHDGLFDDFNDWD